MPTKTFVARLGQDGWLAVGWPKEYGGRGYTPIATADLLRSSVPGRCDPPFVTVNTVGPALMANGSEEHKKKFLPGIAAGELHFAIGYTEGNAGTDLATLSTSAVQEGDHFIVGNGSKLFTSDAESADYIWLACRTHPEEKRHKGISILIVDTKLPGYSLTPIHTVGHRTNATYYDNVKVPANMLVGQLHGGWKLITSQLNHERVGLGAFGVKATGAFQKVLTGPKRRTKTAVVPLTSPGFAAPGPGLQPDRSHASAQLPHLLRPERRSHGCRPGLGLQRSMVPKP